MYQRLLVPVDGSTASNEGLREAVKLAKAAGARLRVIHAIDEFIYGTGLEVYADVGGQLFAQLREQGEQILQSARAAAEKEGVAVETQLFEQSRGTLADLVVSEATAWPADLIVLGTHGRRGLRRMVLGSDAEQILRSAPVPVLLVRGHAEPVAGTGVAEPAASGVPATAA